MKITDYIASAIGRLPKGYVFTYADLITQVNKKEAVIKALNRMAGAGRIAKLSKGKYYKPEQTPFGELQPREAQVVKDLLEDDGKVTGYLTGYSVYNQFGLSTQVSNTIQIGKNDVRPAFKRGRYTISFIRQKNTITKENIPLLQILDAIRYIKKIPDSSTAEACKRLLVLIEGLSIEDKNTMVRLALKYPPATRALLGALLDQIEEKAIATPLYKSLNPITKYKLTGVANVLGASDKWSIV
ncbi:DUF6088 family protein [Pontibacter indicus]|uniref:Transcriptional regulator, AbiEi antitoxin, Type IV TA system n=1 Tax=Pontibacter indicus TaxID=1317125 RepID=A0A1R3XQ49_9BACT|nr:DUF6088 family protein [Pontibacter indicus]SIT94036.1 hypothetical protein SAMN05444128_3405 [Pontibacter indicus]